MRYISLLLTLALIAGCGSKGPLYLPEVEPSETQSAENADRQDASAREEDEEDTP